MSWVRPEITDAVSRGREVILGAFVVGLGLWVAAQGGYLLVPVGVALMILGAGWAVLAWRRLRFAQSSDGPGVVDLDEGQIGYLGPGGEGARSQDGGVGGFVSLVDLVELRLLQLRGRRVWRLKQSDGQALLIPVDAAGAERLFDAFASLPGMDTAALVAGLQSKPATGGRVVALATESRLIWARGGRGITRT
jgi:hypothetical protein